MNPTEKYTNIRGFNFHPWWGSNGRDEWGEKFDGEEYRRVIRQAKAAFPKMNTIRSWLSFDAWYDYREKAVEHYVLAAEILKSEGLQMIPVYFNGWHSVPDFGGFSDETLRLVETQDYQPYRRYLKETAIALEKTGAVLMSDISNEPFNNVCASQTAKNRVMRFLTAMSEELHADTTAPVTVSSQGYYEDFEGKASDLEYLDPIVDVLTIHPYSVAMTPIEEHEEWVKRLVATAEKLGKPVIITECCWGADTDEERGKIIEMELRHYAEAGIGFLVHALADSKVADLHPLDGVNPSMYMPFMMRDGSIRPYHHWFNVY